MNGLFSPAYIRISPEIFHKLSGIFRTTSKERKLSMNTMNGCSGTGSPGTNMGSCQGSMDCSSNMRRNGNTNCRGNMNCNGNMSCNGNANCSGNANCNGNMNRSNNMGCGCNSNGNMGCNRNTIRSGNRCRQNNCGMSPAEMARTMKECQNDPANSCNGDPLYGMPLAIGYVPWQKWCKTYEPCEGLANGTIFPELDLQFYGCIPQGWACKKGGRV